MTLLKNICFHEISSPLFNDFDSVPFAKKSLQFGAVSVSADTPPDSLSNAMKGKKVSLQIAPGISFRVPRKTPDIKEIPKDKIPSSVMTDPRRGSLKERLHWGPNSLKMDETFNKNWTFNFGIAPHFLLSQTLYKSRKHRKYQSNNRFFDDTDDEYQIVEPQISLEYLGTEFAAMVQKSMTCVSFRRKINNIEADVSFPLLKYQSLNKPKFDFDSVGGLKIFWDYLNKPVGSLAIGAILPSAPYEPYIATKISTDKKLEALTRFRLINGFSVGSFKSNLDLFFRFKLQLRNHIEMDKKKSGVSMSLTWSGLSAGVNNRKSFSVLGYEIN